MIFGQIRKDLGEVFQGLARQKECRIEEGNLLADHVHMMLDPTEVFGAPSYWVYQGQRAFISHMVSSRR